MKRKDRFFKALNLEQPDRVPMFDFLFQKPLYRVLIGREPDGYNGKDAVKCALALNHDAVWLPFGGFSGYRPKFLSYNIYQDEWGTTYQKNTSSWPIDAPIAYPIQSRADLVKYCPPDPTLPGRTAEIEAAKNVNNDDIALLGGTTGPFTTAWLLMGYENIGYALYDDPDLLLEVFKISNEFNKEAARLSVQAGCMGIWVSDDFGDSQRGLLRIDHFQKYVLSSFAELVEYVANLGVPVLLHSCGHITDYLDDLAQTKISAIHPLQRTAGMNLRQIKEKHGKRWCIIGNIDSTKTLPFGTPEDVEIEVKEAIDIAAPGGGYVLASDHSLHDGIPVENIIKMFRVGTEYGKLVYQV